MRRPTRPYKAVSRGRLSIFPRLAHFALGLGVLFAVAVGGSLQAQPVQPSAYVLLGERGQRIVRVVTSAAACPSLRIDGRSRPMHPRARAETLPARTTASPRDLSKPADFPVLVCERLVPKSATRALFAGRRLPLPRARLDRIVVVGDTGCRLKASDSAYQACNDPDQYPFARIAAKAAAWKPDLVIHVGDYVYRENPCRADRSGCAGSPWGYGWDAWRADFFTPAAPLLAAAPWVVVRGNHENCARAGQGWWRLLDPWPLEGGRDCLNAADDAQGDYSPPYAVPLGGGAQVVVLDLANAAYTSTPASDPRHGHFRDAYMALDRLSRGARFTFAADHKPILGFSAEQKDGALKLLPGTGGIQSVFSEDGAPLLPKGVDVLLAGHVHLWEQVSFSTDHPSQFVTGFSGTQEDLVPIPETLPSDASPAPGAKVEAFSAWVGGFGYMTLQRLGSVTWRADVWDANGKRVNRCTIVGRKSKCDLSRVANG